MAKSTVRKTAASHPFFSKKVGVSQALSPEQAKQAFQQAYDAGNFALARQRALNFAQAYPNVAQVWADAATCAVHVEDWAGAIDSGLKAVALDGKMLSALDALSHAYGALRERAQASAYGLKALQVREERFGRHIHEAWTVQSPPDFQSSRGRNVIAFSLFGGNSKYCETAVLNAHEQALIYPDWVCRFYVDQSVPSEICARLIAEGTQVVIVDGAMRHWPGTMWRFAAYDDPTVDRVIFRDSDSVISAIEAAAVNAWVESGCAFHLMRDSASHTELILAGLWGCARGSLPNMSGMIENYLQNPPSSARFADQYFLREYVWPYLKRNPTQVLTHDSLFGFFNAKPFPVATNPDDHIGNAEGVAFFEAPVAQPDGTTVWWAVWDQAQSPECMICRYSAVVEKQKIRANLPRRYLQKINRDYVVRISISPTEA